MSPPAPHQFEVEDQPDPAALEALRKGLRDFNASVVGEPSGMRELAVFVRDHKGKILGGVYGWTYWSWLYIDGLWVHESVRRLGHGTKLLKLAEEEAVRRGMGHAYLDTTSFQALPFYQKFGYEVFGVLKDRPPGYESYFLRKDFL